MGRKKARPKEFVKFTLRVNPETYEKSPLYIWTQWAFNQQRNRNFNDASRWKNLKKTKGKITLDE